jgi:hypothetical protein
MTLGLEVVGERKERLVHHPESRPCYAQQKTHGYDNNTPTNIQGEYS